MAQSDIRDRIQAAIDSNTTTGGMSIAIACSHTPAQFFQSGFSNIQDKIPITETHLFGIGSITKLFVAVVVLQLIEEGKLSLHEKVRDHLSETSTHGIDNAANATIAQLLSHTSGIDSWEDDPVWIRDGRGENINLTRIWDRADTLEYLRRPRRTAAELGEWSYSNTNYTLLGLIIESITSNHAEQEIRRRILEPLGMNDTFLEGHEDVNLSDRLTRRYHLATEHFKTTAGISPSFPFTDSKETIIDVTGSNLSVSWLAGGYISSPSDLLSFASALRNGKLLNPSSMALLHDFRPATTLPNHEMGHGLFRQTITGQGSWLGHSGGVLGYGAQLWWAEEGDCVVVVLWNVGTVCAGPVEGGTTGLLRGSEFLGLARELVRS